MSTTAVPRWRIGRGIAVFVLIVVVQLLLAGAWAVYQGLAARSELSAARDSSRAARLALSDVELESARTMFADAADGFESGYNRLSGPVLRATTLLPVVGDDVQATRVLADGGGEISRAAGQILDAIADRGGIGAFAPSDGRLPVDAIAALEQPAAAVVDVLADTEARVLKIDPDGLVDQVAEARSEFIEEVAEARQLAGVAQDVAANLPTFLGADEPRNYLFAAQNPAELRGTGGFMGAYAVVEIDDGALDFSEFIPVQDLQSLPVAQIQAPNPDYAARYDRFGGAGFWQGINATPDFPSAATAIVNLWEATQDTDVDGVIAVDPQAFESLLRISGPIDVPEFGSVGADEIVEVYSTGAREVISDDERKQVLGAIAAGALQGVLGGGNLEPLAAADTLLDVAERGHLKVFSTVGSEQDLLTIFGIDGSLLDRPGDYLAVSVNSGSFTKLDFFMDREVTYDVTLNDDGSADGVATVVFDNSAPTDTQAYPKSVIGPGFRGELEVGENRSYVSVFCDVGCELKPEEGFTVEEELGHGVLSGFITIESGQTGTVTARWHAPKAWDPGGDRYILTYQAQSTLRPTRVRVKVTAPENTVLENGGEWSGKAEGDVTISLDVSRA